MGMVWVVLALIAEPLVLDFITGVRLHLGQQHSGPFLSLNGHLLTTAVLTIRFIGSRVQRLSALKGLVIVDAEMLAQFLAHHVNVGHLAVPHRPTFAS